MPGVHIAAWYNNPTTTTTTLTPKITMSSKSAQAANKQQISFFRSESNNIHVRTPILVFISAHALGSLGFALSLLSIWLGWLLPTSPAPVLAPEPESTEIKKARSPSRHTKKSSQPVSPKITQPPRPLRRASAPIDLPSILVPHSDDSPQQRKRVCFVDTPPSPITRRNTMPEPSTSSYHAPSLHQLVEASISSSSTSSTCETEEHVPLEAAVTAALEDLESHSDSSRPPSRTSFTKTGSRFQKLKLGFNVKSPRLPPPPQSEQQGDQASVSSIEATSLSEKSTKRASGSFMQSWSITRPRTAPDVASRSRPCSPARLAFMGRSTPPSGPSPASSTTSLCTQTVDILTRKAQRRTSTPIPRTNPYGAPYFAEPPIPYDTKKKKRASQIHSSPRQSSEGNSDPSTNSSDVEPRGRTRLNSIRRVALNPQTSHPLVKQRSASEHTSQRHVICV